MHVCIVVGVKLPVFWNSVNISERRQKRQNGSQLKIAKKFVNIDDIFASVKYASQHIS
jgi:hypothetical protein